MIENGPFAEAFAKLQGKEFKLRWQSRTAAVIPSQEENRQQDKIHMAGCGTNAWAKPDTALICRDCHKDGKTLVMQAELEIRDRRPYIL